MFLSAEDGNVEAYDSRTGDVLWKYQTGAGSGAGSPASYEIDGEQYIAVPMGARVWAFKLRSREIAPALSTPSLQEEEAFSGPIVDTEEIETTSLKRSLFGSGTRYFIDEYSFNPYRARVKVGAKVLFVNNGNLRHEFAATDGSWSTGPLNPAQEAWITFDTVARHTYICRDHPWSYGQIIVLDAPTDSHRTSTTSPTPPTHRGEVTEQVNRGKEYFNKSCSVCHGEDLSGRAAAPALLGAAFTARWRNATVVDLFDNVRATMPQTSPGSLDRQTYIDIVSYLLRANDLSSGANPLTYDPEALRHIKIESIK